MKKITAIIFAVLLAFAIAMGDQIIKLSLADSPLSFSAIKSYFIKDEIPVHKPMIPKVDEPAPEEVNLSYDERLKKGDYYFDRGFLTYASNEYVKASNLEPTRPEPYRKLMNVNFELADYSKAKKNAEKILELTPNAFDVRFDLVKINIRLNAFTEARSGIESLQTSGLTDSRLDYLTALLDIAFGEHDNAYKILTSLSADPTLDTDTSKHVFKLLSAYQEFDFAKSAEDLYLGELLARGLNQIGEYELAVYKLKDILRTRTDLRDSWIMLGFAYLNLKNTLFALTSFEHAYELDPEWPATQYFLGVTYSELSQFDDAIVYFNYALENGFEPAIVVKQKLADLYLEKMEYAKAVAAYEEVLEFTKGDINAFVRPIWIYLDFLNEPQKAMKLAEMTVISFPEDPMAYNLLGWSQTGMGNYIEAEKNLKKAIATDPTLAAAYYNLGKLYEELSESDNALDSYQKAYELDQNGSIGNLSAKRYNALLTQ